jgi:hypothetical protein
MIKEHTIGQVHSILHLLILDKDPEDILFTIGTTDKDRIKRKMKELKKYE